jgi:RND family efflux transporter MFP subunit
MFHRYALLLPVLVSALAGCKPENKFRPPQPPEISVAVPLQQNVVSYEVLTGNTVAFATVDLVARVKGFLTGISYADGSFVRKGDVLFQIERTMYEANLQEAEAQLAAAKAELVQAEAELVRQETLLHENVSARAAYDKARARRDADRASVENAQGSLIVARTNLGYTTVLAPFDGVVSKHLASIGELVGSGTETRLATIVQLDPIYVEFTMSEQDALKLRTKLKRRLTREGLHKMPLEIGLMGEEGFPHKGGLDYVAPDFDPATGTILMRGLFQNPNHDLVPGFFVRVRVPRGQDAEKVLLIPNRVIAENQAGMYVLVVNNDDVVEQRQIKDGPLLVGGLRVVASGLKPDDRVVLTTGGRLVPGNKVVPRAGKIEAPPAEVEATR